MSNTHQYSFAHVPSANIPRSVFNRSHNHKTTIGSGFLYPIYLEEVLPGDTFNVRMHVFGRLSTPIVPFMDDVWLDYFFFFVPTRLVWDHHENQHGYQKNPGDTTDYLTPVVDMSPGAAVAGPQYSRVKCSLWDYFGLPLDLWFADSPTATWQGVSLVRTPPVVSAIPFRSYYLIWNEWFRDQNHQDSAEIPLGDGPDDLFYSSETMFGLARSNRRHDYFTSCLPWPQKGPGVSLPLSGNAFVKLFDQTTLPGNDVLPQKFVSTDANRNYVTNPVLASGATSNINLVGLTPNPNPFNTWYAGSQASSIQWLDPNGTLVADLTNVNSATINSLRQAFQMQKVYERDARGGTRYTEMLRSHFGVISPDMRLQRPEYLGGGSVRVSVSPVAQTSSTDTKTPQGNLAAYGTVMGSKHGFSKSFTEHGNIIGLARVRADVSYQQQLPRMWTRRTRFDYYLPAFAHLGEQAVLNQERKFYFYARTDENAVKNEDVFGYQERFAEYRYKPSYVTGLYRSVGDPSGIEQHAAQNPDWESYYTSPASGTYSLDFWHLALDDNRLYTPGFLGGQPNLTSWYRSSDFYKTACDLAGTIIDRPPLHRVLAFTPPVVPDSSTYDIEAWQYHNSQVLLDIHFQVRAARPMPLYSVPGLIDHF